MLNYMNPDQDSCSITYEQYATNKFILGITFEKMNEANMTGINTKMGSLMTAKIKPYKTLSKMGSLMTEKIKPYKTLTENEMIQEIFVHMISEAIVEIRSDSSVVYD